MTVLQDIRYAIRVLARNPGFTIVGALTIGIALGANTTIYAVLSGVLFKPLPYAQPHGLVDVYETFEPKGFGSAAAANFLDWRRWNRSFDSLSAYVYVDPTLNGLASAERLEAIAATADVFQTLGVSPALGRIFAPAEDREGAAGVVVLSDGLWRRLGADRAIVGKEIKLNGAPASIIGVMPPGFTFPPGYVADAWMPLKWSVAQAGVRDERNLSVIGRLRSGVTLEAASSDMRAIAAHLETLYPKQQAHRGVLIRPMSVELTGDLRPPLFRMFGFVGFVLLIACANVANLLMARAAFRRREIAMRAALGAGRNRLLRQLLIESVVLSLVGALVGIVFAEGGVQTVARLATGILPRVQDISIDATVFLFLLCVSVLTGIAFGLVPAISVSRAQLQELLREGGGGSIGLRQRPVQALLVAEFALALLLLVGAGLMLKSFVLLMSTPTGFNAHGVLTMHVALPVKKYAAGPWRLFYEPVLERIAAVPTIQAAGFISKLPLQEAGTNGLFEIEGQPAPAEGQPRAELRIVSPGYFQAMGVPVVRGRAINATDTASAPAAMMINEALAKRYFKDNPVGHSIRAFRSWRIVGIAASVRQASLDEPARPEIYVPISQIPEPAWISNMVFLVRSGHPLSTISSVRAVIQSVDPAQPIFAVQSMEDVVARSLAGRRFYVWLSAVLGGLALLLAAAGAYGVMSYFIAQRRREFGIRLALGGTQAQILRSVLGSALALAGVGSVIGLAAAALLTRVLSAFLYGVHPVDAEVFIGITLALLLVAVASAWLPAWRATRIDAAVALRDQ